MKLTVVANNPHARLVDGEAVKHFAVALDGNADAVDGVSLSFRTTDAALAAKFPLGATLEVDLGAVQEPPAPEAEE